MTENETFYDKLKAHREATTQANSFNKRVVFDVLSQAGIDTVTVTFDGCGDSGQIEEIKAVTNRALVSFPDVRLALQTTSFGDEEFTMKEVSVREAIEELCYGYLEQEHDGWEIDDGAFGEFTLNVTERRVVLNFNSRFTDHFHSTQAF